MDKAITTALLIVASVVMALMLFNAAYPAIVEGGDAITSMADRTGDRMRSQISVIHATSELNASNTFADTNGNNEFDVFFWVKNTGATRITAIENMDVFFGPEGNFQRIRHQSATGSGFPYWSYTIEDAADWDPTTTLRITVNLGTTPAQGRYFIKVTTSTGAADDTFLGI
jgi:archaellum component FlaG (FlaF/FlaG flagellin family)